MHTLRTASVVASLALLIATVTAGSVLAQPGNDSALAPTVIGSLPFSDSLDTTTATADAGDPSAFCGPSTNTVWYTFNAGPTGNGHVTLSTGASNYTAMIYVTTGSPSGPFQTCGGTQIELIAAPSTTYYIMIGDCCGAGGMLELSVTQGIAFAGTIDPKASFVAKTGVVTLTGTYSCNSLATISGIEVELKQAVGRFIISGAGGTIPTGQCLPGTSYRWTAQVAGSNGKFAGGKATAQLVIEGQDASGAGWSSSTAKVPVKLAR